jgi:phosphocarrier protein
MAEEGKYSAISRIVIIQNKLGLHARAAALFRECAAKFKSDITVVKNHMEANAKSLLGLIALGAAQGTELKVVARGEDAEAALLELESLVNRMFEEHE